MSEKIYIGGAKEKVWEDGNSSFSISFGEKDLALLLANKNEKGYVNLKMTKRREPSQYGQTHSIVVDDWKPSNAGQSAPVQGTQVSNTPDFDDPNSIPF
jgi:hypothetical protein